MRGQAAMREELIRWHSPHAAEQIVSRIVTRLKTMGHWHWDINESVLSVAMK